MLKKLSDTLYRFATGRNVLIFFLLDALFMFGVMPAAGARLAAATGGVGPLDLNLYYSGAQAVETLGAMGAEGRALYRTIELALDIVYPVAYTLFFSLLISWLFNKGLSAQSRLRGWNVLPFGGFLFDLLENASIVGMIGLFPAVPPVLASAAGVFTLLKWLFAGGSMALALVGLVSWLRKRTQKA
ncbi:MAG: hypothetical protein EPO32_06250 [Anaerolineae bacterium]|nr:MAG: hypothetical protein EPO32_06250 [Anaerolineae bacterium]